MQKRTRRIGPEQRWGWALLGGMLSIPTWCPCLAFLVPLTDWGGWVAPMYFCTPSAPVFSALMFRGEGVVGLGLPPSRAAFLARAGDWTEMIMRCL